MLVTIALGNAAFSRVMSYRFFASSSRSSLEGNCRVAKETITKLIDDLDGGEAQETVKFGLDGHSFEIDLSTKNATKLRSALAPYVESGTRLTGRTFSIGGRSSGGRPRTGAVGEREQNKAIRAWALRRGLDVAPRGRIKVDVVEQYHREAGR
jgi:nucleoid-associated protein Lsr2